jgi:hypothetical protein
MRLPYVFFLPLATIALFAQTPATNSTSSQQSPVTGYTAPLFNATTRNVILDAVVTDRTSDAKGRLSAQITIAAADKGKHGKHGAWQPSVLHVYTVSLPDGVAPSPATQTSVNFEMPYRDSDRLRFIVRDDASGRVGSSEITLNPAKTS